MCRSAIPRLDPLNMTNRGAVRYRKSVKGLLMFLFNEVPMAAAIVKTDETVIFLIP